MKPESTEWAFVRYVRRARVLLALVGFTCVLAACGSGGSYDDSSDGGTTPPDTSTPAQLRCAP